MNEIIINKEKNIKSVLLVSNGILVEKYQCSDNQIEIEGNIYVGIIKDILIGMQAAFVDIGEEKNAFIHLEEILGKNYTKKDISKLKVGMSVIVQVKRGETSSKGARIVTNIQLPGRYLVFMPKENFVTVSQKIENEEEKKRLINIIKKYLPDNTGVILRTSSINKNEEEIRQDLENLIKKWEEIKNQVIQDVKKPLLLYKSPNISEKIIIDMIDRETEKILVNSKDIYDEINNILTKMKNQKTKLELREENLLNMYDIAKSIEETKKRKIWLKCGGFITIDKTEALTAIDVNSGKFIGKENLEKTVFKVNKDASIEIARQLRLRDIGGIIVIDYINMSDKNNKEEIIKILSENLKNDRAKTQIMGFSKLDLLEMTRKHLHS